MLQRPDSTQGPRSAADRAREETPPWVQAIIDRAKEVVPETFVGNIMINVFKTGVSNAKVEQTFLDAHPEVKRVKAYAAAD